MGIIDRLKREDPAALRRLEDGCIIQPPELPSCAVAAMARIARAAGVTLPDCDGGADCEHPRLPRGYGSLLPRGTNLAAALHSIESAVFGELEPDNPPRQAPLPS